MVYAKRSFAGPAAVLAYLSRYTHRTAIANSRLLSMDERGVRFKWKDYRVKGRCRHKTMTLEAGEFVRRFLLHVLPKRFHRIRHYGFNANSGRRENLARARILLGSSGAADTPESQGADPVPSETSFGVAPLASSPVICPDCGAPMVVVESFAAGFLPCAPPPAMGQT